MEENSAGKLKKIHSIGQSMLKNSYSPYSEFSVSAVAISKNGNLFAGTNIENTSYSLTICAEVCAIANMVSNGNTELTEIFIFSASDKFVTPCGACRQVILEFSKTDINVNLVNQDNQIRTHKLSSLIPHAFHLEEETA